MFKDKQAVQTPVAAVWHTLLVLALLAGMVALSLSHGLAPVLAGLLAHRPAALTPHILSYLATLISEWLIFIAIWVGVKMHGTPFRDVFGAFSLNPVKILIDLGLAFGFLIGANLVLSTLGYIVHAPHATSGVRELIPHGNVESLLFLALAFTAGVCEETIFRGYLQKQFTAWSNSALIGIVAQGLIFGFAHAYQGWILAGLIGVYGMLFGLLAMWRQSLRPGMIAHFAQDAIAGLVLARYLVK